MGYAGEVERQPVNDFVVGLSSCVRFINPLSPYKLSRAFDAEDSGYLGIVDFLPTKHTVVFGRWYFENLCA